MTGYSCYPKYVSENNDTKEIHACDEKFVKKFENDKCRIYKSTGLGDVYLPDYLLTDKKLDYLILSICQKIKLDSTPYEEEKYFQITKLPLRFCQKLTKETDEPEYLNGKYVYDIRSIWEKLGYHELNTLRFDYVFEIQHKHKSNVQAKLIGRLIYLAYRGTVATRQYHLQTVLFTEKRVDLVKGINEIVLLDKKQNIYDVREPTKGFFLDCIDINNINGIELFMNGHSGIKYDNDLLKLYSKKISDDCYYISIDFYDNDLFTKWIGCGKYDKVGLTLSLKIDYKSKKNIIIRFTTGDVLEIKDKSNDNDEPEVKFRYDHEFNRYGFNKC